MKSKILILYLFAFLCPIMLLGQTSAALTSEQKSWLAKGNPA